MEWHKVGLLSCCVCLLTQGCTTNSSTTAMRNAPSDAVMRKANVISPFTAYEHHGYPLYKVCMNNSINRIHMNISGQSYTMFQHEAEYVEDIGNNIYRDNNGYGKRYVLIEDALCIYGNGPYTLWSGERLVLIHVNDTPWVLISTKQLGLISLTIFGSNRLVVPLEIHVTKESSNGKLSGVKELGIFWHDHHAKGTGLHIIWRPDGDVSHLADVYENSGNGELGMVGILKLEGEKIQLVEAPENIGQNKKDPNELKESEE